MWHTVGPILAQSYAVVAPDLLGMGQSTLSESREYSSERAADAVLALLDFLSLDSAYVFGYDKGASVASLIAWKYPHRVRKLAVAEYALPAFGHEIIQNPDPAKSLFGHWHLALFTIPEAAEFLIRGHEKEFLHWYFWHSSYSLGATMSLEHIERYAASLSKPGYLRAMAEFLNGKIWKEIEYFQPLREDPISVPMIVFWGEGSMVSPDLSHLLWGPTAKDLKTIIVPKAGHWLGESYLDALPLLERN